MKKLMIFLLAYLKLQYYYVWIW